MIKIVRAAERQLMVQENLLVHGLPLDTYLNEDYGGLSQLKKVEHLEVQRGYSEKMHLHKDEDILLYIRSGTMLYEDLSGMKVPLYHSHLLAMNTGNGLFHKISIPPNIEKVEALQIIMPSDEDAVMPQVQFHVLRETYSLNRWRLIAGNEKTSAPLNIHGNIALYDVRLHNDILLTPSRKNFSGLLYVVDGSVTEVEYNIRLQKGDMAIVKDELLLLDASTPADLVFFNANETPNNENVN